MLCLYMPSCDTDGDRVSHVVQFIDGHGKFKYLFTKKENTDDSNTTNIFPALSLY